MGPVSQAKHNSHTSHTPHWPPCKWPITSGRPIFNTLLHDFPACFLCNLETEIPIISNA